MVVQEICLDLETSINLCKVNTISCTCIAALSLSLGQGVDDWLHSSREKADGEWLQELGVVRYHALQRSSNNEYLC